MKCSVTSRNSWSASGKVLTVGSANVFLDIEGIENGQVVVPVQLKYVKRDNSFGRPLVDVRQPQYKTKDGKYHTSYLSVHLNGAAEKGIEKLVTGDWLKGEIKRLFKSGKAGDYERNEEGWVHVADRVMTAGGTNPEDESFLSEAIIAADELAAKAQKAAGTVAQGSNTEKDAATAASVLNS
jgi:hypothetical protein